MYIYRLFCVVFKIFIFLCCFNAPNTFADWEHIPGQMTVEIFQAPTPLKALDQYYLVYELHLTNYHSSPIELTSLEIRDTKNSALFEFNKETLVPLIHAIGSKDSKPNNILDPGAAKMIFLFLPFKDKLAIPNQLNHHFIFNTKRHQEKVTLSVTTDPIKITKTDPIIVSPPLHGDYWVAGSGPSNTSDHRIANMVVNGHDYFAQRYAIDFIQVNNNGITYHNDEHQNKNYYAYGQNIYSVAPGVVTEVKDGIPENIPHSGKTAVPMDMDTVAGNHIVVDLGNGHYSFYAHLIPGSVTVRKGDTVKRGQILGKIGNSGNTTEPHLHFHIVDKPSFIAANGIPYGFDSFFVRPSKLISADPAFKIQILDKLLQPMRNQLVLENTVMKFPG